MQYAIYVMYSERRINVEVAFWPSNTPQLDRRTFKRIHPNPADARILIWLVAQIQNHK
jgi:hypothetical protein